MGTCTLLKNSWMHQYDSATTLFEVNCATCKNPTIFAVPHDEITIHCNMCDAKMLVKTVVDEEEEYLEPLDWDVGISILGDLENVTFPSEKEGQLAKRAKATPVNSEVESLSNLSKTTFSGHEPRSS